MNRDNPRKDEDEQRLLVNSFAANSDRYKGFSSCWRFTGSPPQLASFAFRLAPTHKIPFPDVTIGQSLHIHIGNIYIFIIIKPDSPRNLYLIIFCTFYLCQQLAAVSTSTFLYFFFAAPHKY